MYSSQLMSYIVSDKKNSNILAKEDVPKQTSPISGIMNVLNAVVFNHKKVMN